MNIRSLTLGLCVLLCACGPAYHLRKAKYHILKAQSQGAQWSSDTVVVTKYVTPAPFSGDTTIQLKTDWTVVSDTIASLDHSFGDSFSTDTLRLVKKGIDTKVKITGHKAYIKTKCTPDTVRISVPVHVSNAIECPPCVQRIRWWVALISGISLLILGIAIGRLVLK